MWFHMGVICIATSKIYKPVEFSNGDPNISTYITVVRKLYEHNWIHTLYPIHSYIWKMMEIGNYHW